MGKYDDRIISDTKTEMEFKGLVSDIIHYKLREYSKKHVDVLDNTYLPPNERTHFCTDNITSIYNSIISGGYFKLIPKYLITDYHYYVIGEQQVIKNRINFCYKILNTVDILNFLFLNFRFN